MSFRESASAYSLVTQGRKNFDHRTHKSDIIYEIHHKEGRMTDRAEK